MFGNDFVTRPKVYIETTIPSFYHEVRTDPESVARKNWTRNWWELKREEYSIVTSEAVLEELERGRHPVKSGALELLEGIPVLDIDPSVLEIVQTYIDHSVMPADPAGDALHLALTSFHKIDFLLTWNCSHLANANKFSHIRIVNTMLGLFVPNLVTPLELLAEGT